MPDPSSVKLKIIIWFLALLLCEFVWFNWNVSERYKTDVKMYQSALISSEVEMIVLNAKISDMGKDVEALKRKCKILCKDAAAAWLDGDSK